MKKSAGTGPDEIMESIYEDPDSLMGAVADGGQSPDQMEVKVKPVPLPRIKSQHQPNSNNNTADTLNKTHSTINAAGSQSKRQSMPRPVLPPPRPPVNKHVNPAAVVRGNSDYSKSITETTAMLRDLRLEKKPPPLPLRPKLPPTSPMLYTDRAPSAKSLTSESGTGTAQQRSSVSFMSQGPISPAGALSSYSNYQEQATDRSSRDGFAQPQYQPSSIYRSTSTTQLSSQTRRSPPSFSPPSPPSEPNNYSLREFPSYLDIIPNEADVTTPMMSTHQSDPDYNSVYQLSTDLRDLRLEKKPPPLPLRPKLPPTSPMLYTDRAPSAKSLTSESGTGTAQQRSSVSFMSQGPVSPAGALSSYSNYQAQATDRSSRDGFAQPQYQPSSIYRSTSTTQLSSQTRRSPPSFSPPSPPSEPNNYSLREFPSYLDIIPNEADVTTPMMSTHQSDPDYNSVYQLSTDDITALLTWLKRVCREPDVMAPSLFGLDTEEEIRSFNKRAMNIRIARRLYNLLMMKRRDSLQNSIKEFQSISEKLEKVKKTSKNMGIAGGTTGAVGGVAAVVGIALAPVTMGTSLIATAAGAGMVASAGGFGIHAAKANKKSVNRTTVEKIANDYKSDVADIELCLQFILSGMNELRRHNTVKLQSAGAHPDALRMADLSHAVFRNLNNSKGMSLIHPGGVTSGSLLKAFATEIDEYFTEKNNQKLKKSNKSKFAGRISSLAKALQEELNYLIQMWEMLC
ncbi:uncharacterized protein KIAA1522-like isoform X2 [Melanotaenia boesemani]|nr:uncharacterized protein KIAA1522-like isoform X2 [Melanotaenia boesemani]